MAQMIRSALGGGSNPYFGDARVAIRETQLDDPDVDHWATPLAYAVVHGPIDSVRELAQVKELLEVPCRIEDGPHHFEATPLQLAVRTSRYDACQILLENGADYQRDADRFSLLHQAVAQRSTRTVQVLIRHARALLKARDSNGLTPLLLAARMGSFILCQVLVEQGAPLDAKDPKGNNVFHFAIAAYLERCADLELIRYLARYRSSLLRERNAMGYTPVDLAATSNDPKLYEVLAAHGSDEAACLLLTRDVSGAKPPANVPNSKPKRHINSRSANGSTALLRAASLGQAHVCRILLQTGADPLLIQPDSGKSALHLAVEHRQARVVELLAKIPGLLEHRDHKGDTPLVMAASLNHEASVEVLLEAGARVDVRGAGGRSAIHWASSHRNASLVGKLMSVFLSYAQEPDEAREVSGSKPPVNEELTELLFAIHENDLETVEALAKNQQLVNARSQNGDTPLLMAASCGNGPACEILLRNGANPLLTTVGLGRSALHLAVEHRHLNVIELLAANEELLELTDGDGNTPLVFASYLNHESEALALLEAGANLAVQGKFGRSALHWAAFNGNAKMIEQIVQIFLAYVNDKPLPANSEPFSFVEQGELGRAFRLWMRRSGSITVTAKVERVFNVLRKEEAALLSARDVNRQGPWQLVQSRGTLQAFAALDRARVRLYIAVKRKMNGV